MMELPAMGTTQYGTAMAASNILALGSLNQWNSSTTAGGDWSNQAQGSQLYISRSANAAMQNQPKKETT